MQPSSLSRTSSSLTGAWGEESGEAVDVEHVWHRLEQVQEARDDQIPHNTVADKERVETDLELGTQDEADVFKLRDFLVAHSHQTPTDRKPIGVAWTNLSVSAPAQAVAGGVFVKTLPIAITNTAWRDPYTILRTLIPPLRKLEPGTKDLVHIVHPTTGVLRAGQMLLVLGSPGSGCTTFLKAIASSLDPSVQAGGYITYGGLSSEAIQTKFRGEVRSFQSVVVQSNLALTRPSRPGCIRRRGRRPFPFHYCRRGAQVRSPNQGTQQVNAWWTVAGRVYRAATRHLPRHVRYAPRTRHDCGQRDGSWRVRW